MIKKVISKLQSIRFSREWRKKNSHNMTYPAGSFDINQVHVGKGTYGTVRALMFNKESQLSIGNYCSIAPEVMFIGGADHYVDRISTYPFKAKVVDKNISEGISKGDIIVEDDVWIGYRATILSGVHVGQGAVIAAGSVITKDVPPYAIVGGVPGGVIKYRFTEDIIGELLKVDFSKLDEKMINKHIEPLYEKLQNKEQLEWLPKKNFWN